MLHHQIACSRYRAPVRPHRDIVLIRALHGSQIALVNGTKRNGYPECQFPGGRVRNGELPSAAAHRKARDELGLHVEPHRLRFIGKRMRELTQVTHTVHLFEIELSPGEWDTLPEKSGDKYYVEKYEKRDAMLVLEHKDLSFID